MLQDIGLPIDITRMPFNVLKKIVYFTARTAAF